jgi:phosphohistidine phosphatase
VKRLTLFRHAKSSWNDPELPDNERPLTSRGERDAPAMAARLGARGDRPNVVLTSHAVRAAATARAITATLGCPDGTLRVDRRIYLASAERLLELLRAQDDRDAHVLVVGHNPGLTEVANRLLPTFGVDNVPTAGIVAIAVDSERWSSLAPEVCRLLFYDYPKSAGTK